MIPLPDRLARPGLAATALMAALVAAGPAHAALDQADPLAGLEPIAAAEMGEARGGMTINGIPINFALRMRTMVEGANPFGLETVFTVNDNGSLGSGSTTMIGGASGTAMTSTGNGFSLALPSGVTLSHEVIDGQIRTYLANNLDGVKLNQHVDLDITLPGMTAASQSWAAGKAAARANLEVLRGSLTR